jgi:transposase
MAGFAGGIRPLEYKARHAVENLFARLKPFRSLATRYDKTVRNDSAMVAIACIALWLRL